MEHLLPRRFTHIAVKSVLAIHWHMDLSTWLLQVLTTWRLASPTASDLIRQGGNQNVFYNLALEVIPHQNHNIPLFNMGLLHYSVGHGRRTRNTRMQGLLEVILEDGCHTMGNACVGKNSLNTHSWGKMITWNLQKICSSFNSILHLNQKPL